MLCFEERRSIVRFRKVNGKGIIGEECFKYNFIYLEQELQILNCFRVKGGIVFECFFLEFFNVWGIFKM